ncbi:MAG: YicC family protein [Caldiserica bacterium]|nr:YicC family protein [Caldisericota bacterium]
MRSMTGFGRGRADGDGFTIQVDVRSLNHRFLEVRVRGLSDMPALAVRCEEAVKARFSRGSFDVNVLLDFGGFRRPRAVNRAAAKRLWEELSLLAREIGCAEPSLEAILSLGVVQEESPDEEEIWPVLEAALDRALDEVGSFREREGAGLAEALRREAGILAKLISRAEAEVPRAQEAFAERLRERISGLGILDEARISLEVSIWAERTDVREELDRLRAHHARLEELLDAEGPVGRELEFLAQEIGREANTLAAKARGVPLGEVALELKLCAERIREQARNVE